MQLLLIVASVIWGINVIVMKVIMEILPMYLVAGIRVFCASIIVGAILLFKKQSIKISMKQFWVVLCISFFNVSLNFYLSFTGLRLLEGSSTAIINALSPMVTSILSYLILKEKLHKKTLMGVLISVFGFIVSIRFNISALSMGSWFLLASLVAYSYSTILVKQKGEGIPFLVISFYSLLLGALQLLTLSYIFEGLPIGLITTLSLQNLLLFLIFSICGFAFIQSVHLRAVNTLGPTTTSFYLNLNPIFTYLAAIIFLGEDIDIFQVIGFIIILISLFIERKKRS